MWNLAALLAAAQPRVAIIGSGVSGASAAHFLRELRPDARIVVFERDARAGGRARTRLWDRDGPLLDEGATSISSLNRYLVGWMDMLNISRTDTPASELGIYDGSEIVFRADPSSSLFAARVLWRYGLSPLRLRDTLRATVANLTKLYDLQQRGAHFRTPARMLADVGLYEATQRTARDDLRAAGVDERFVREFVDGANRDNYLQSSAELNSLVNQVSLAGAALEGSVFRVAGGVQRLVEGVLGASGARLELGTSVFAVERAAGAAGFTLVSNSSRRTSGSGSAALSREAFDAVVIAAPLEASALRVRVESIADPPRGRPFVRTHVTFVEAAGLNASRFGAQASRAIGQLLTVDADSEVEFTAIGMCALLPPAASPPARSEAAQAQRRAIWKLFSKRALSDGQLDALFQGRTARTRRVVWDRPGAYPRLGPTSVWPPFELAPGLAYAGAMESPVSCMETQAIAGRNAALLVAKALPKRQLGVLPATQGQLQ
jgi:prenylcysteine oxidase/farnesylcysteine lyase